MAETWTIPLDDDGTGGVVAEFRITGDVEWTTLVSLAETLSRARHRVALTFAPPGPPPAFVPMAEAVRILGTSIRHVRKLIEEGHLAEVLWQEGNDGELSPVVGDDGESMEPNPVDKATRRVIPYDQLVAVATRAVEAGHYPAVPKGQLSQGRKITRVEWRETLVGILRDRNPEEFTRTELRQRVREHYLALGERPSVTLARIDEAITDGIRAGRIAKRHLGSLKAPLYSYIKMDPHDNLRLGHMTKAAREELRRAKEVNS